MKKVNTILLSGLFAVILTFTQCTGSQSPNADGNVASEKKNNTEASGFAYFLLDSVMINFDMFLDKNDELQAKQTEYETKLNSEGSKFEKNYQDYVNKVNKGLITRATATEMEQSLTQQQQDFQNLTIQYQNELAEAQAIAENQVIDYIETFLKENRDTYNYRYVFAKQFGGQLYYADEADDISARLIKDLNAKYNSEKK